MPLFYAAHVIEYKNVKPPPSVVDPTIEILKIGSMTIFIKNAKPDLLQSILPLKNLKIGGFCDFQLSPFICRKGFGESRIFFGSFLFEKK